MQENTEKWRDCLVDLLASKKGLDLLDCKSRSIKGVSCQLYEFLGLLFIEFDLSQVCLGEARELADMGQHLVLHSGEL